MQVPPNFLAEGLMFNIKFSVSTTQELVGRNMVTIVAQNAEGTDLSAFERKVVYKDTTETISGGLTFEGSVSVDTLHFESEWCECVGGVGWGI